MKKFILIAVSLSALTGCSKYVDMLENSLSGREKPTVRAFSVWDGPGGQEGAQRASMLCWEGISKRSEGRDGLIEPWPSRGNIEPCMNQQGYSLRR